MPESESQNVPALIRRTVCFSGTVQGVNFRYTTWSAASRFRVTGFVRNLFDGRVELVAEGTRDEIDRFQRAIADAMHGYIHHCEASDSAATGEYTSFSIAR